MTAKNAAWPLILVLLTACAGEVGEPDLASTSTPKGFGDAIAQNTSAQIANPDAPPDHPLETSGARAAVAAQRYQTDTAEPPSLPSTQDKLETE